MCTHGRDQTAKRRSVQSTPEREGGAKFIVAVGRVLILFQQFAGRLQTMFPYRRIPRPLTMRIHATRVSQDVRLDDGPAHAADSRCVGR